MGRRGRREGWGGGRDGEEGGMGRREGWGGGMGEEEGWMGRTGMDGTSWKDLLVGGGK